MMVPLKPCRRGGTDFVEVGLEGSLCLEELDRARDLVLPLLCPKERTVYSGPACPK